MELPPFAWGDGREIGTGERLYAVYRLRDENAIDHSGNREFATGYMEDKAEAQRIADRMNHCEQGDKEIDK